MVKQSLDLSAVFGALADPTRRRILEILRAGEKRVTELAAPFRISLAAVSKHLRVLERAGLVTRTKEGRVHQMRANPDAVSEAKRWLEQYAQGWDDSFDALDRYLQQQHGEKGAQDEE